MDLSRASSPMLTAEATPSPIQLTPRSKVNAFLAQFDNTSDNDGNGTPILGTARARLAAKFSKTADFKIAENAEAMSGNSKRHYSPAKSSRVPHDEDDGGDDEAVLPPRRTKKTRADPESDDRDQSASSPVHKATKKSPNITESLPSDSKAPGDSIGESEEEMPTKSRQRYFRTSSVKTPTQSPVKENISPGLFISPGVHNAAHPLENNTDSDEPLAKSNTSMRSLNLAAKIRQERKAKEAKAQQERAEKVARSKMHAEMLERDHSDGSEDDGGRRLTQQIQPARKASKKAMEEMARESQRLSRNHQLTYQATTKKKYSKTNFFQRLNFHPDVLEDQSKPTSSSPAPQSDVEMYETPPTSPISHNRDASKSTLEENASCRFTVEHPILPTDDHKAPVVQSALARTTSSPPTSRQDTYKQKDLKHLGSKDPKPTKPLLKHRPIKIPPPGTVNTAEVSDDDLEIVQTNSLPRKSNIDQFLQRIPERKAGESRSLSTLRILAHVTSPGKQSLRQSKKSSMDSNTLRMSLQQRARQQAALERQERIQKLEDSGVIIQTAEERESAQAQAEDIMAKARREGVEIMKQEREAAKKERQSNGDVDAHDYSSDEDWDEEEDETADEVASSDSHESIEGSEEDMKNDEGEDGYEDKDKTVLGNEDNEDVIMNPLFDEDVSEDEEEDEHAKASRASRGESISNGKLKVNCDGKDAQTIQAPGSESIMNGREDDSEEENVSVNQRPRSRKVKIISDDEDEDKDITNDIASPQTDTPIKPQLRSPAAPNSVLRSASKTFIPGVTIIGPADLGLTQIFAGTMDDHQSNDPEATPVTLDFESKHISNQDTTELLGMQRSKLPSFMPTEIEKSQDVIKDSQPHGSNSQRMADEPFAQPDSQSQLQKYSGLGLDLFATQYSENGPPTQEAIFSKMTPILNRFACPPPSTIDTIMLTGTPLETQHVKPKRKLRQKLQYEASGDEDEMGKDYLNEEHPIDSPKSLFAVMKKNSTKKPLETFDRKKSYARDMIQEQAEESDDEYAGIGGVSDDESDGEDNNLVEMIDDEGGNDADEGQLAAFFADRERASDEKQVEKLFKDISKGMLRRKRGANYDLSDSDDDGEARRRMKQKEFARMRKALLADERIGKIAENPKKQAFLRSIEDRNSDDDMNILEDSTDQAMAGSQSSSQTPHEESQQRIPDSQPSATGPANSHKDAEDSTASTQLRRAPHLRRPKSDKRPSNLSEIRESLSSLIEEPNTLLNHSDSGADSEDGEEHKILQSHLGSNEPSNSRDKENRNPFHLRRTSIPIIDRIFIKRNSSFGQSANSNTSLAFRADSSAAPGFKVPALLRRATTNSSLASSTSTANASVSGGSSNGFSVTERMAGGVDSGIGAVRRGGGKKSGVNYFARESERRAKVGEMERRREEKIVKGARGRKKVVDGLFGKGKFV